MKLGSVHADLYYLLKRFSGVFLDSYLDFYYSADGSLCRYCDPSEAVKKAMLFNAHEPACLSYCGRGMTGVHSRINNIHAKYAASVI